MDNKIKQEQIKQSIREREERLLLVLDATEDGICDWNIITNEGFCSSRWCEIIGYSFDDPALSHTFESWKSRIHADDHERVMLVLNSHLKDGTVYDVDYRHLHKSGKYRWQNSKGKALHNKVGKPYRMVGCIRDISSRKSTEQQLVETTKLLDTVISNLPFGVAFLEGPDFRYVKINEELARLNGLPVEEHLGKTLVEVLPFAKESIIPELTRVIETGEPILNRKFSIKLPSSQKEKQLIDWHIPIPNSNNEIASIISVVCDITDLHYAQLKLKNAHKMEALGTLAGGIAHDFNNILGIILGNIDLSKLKLDPNNESFLFLDNIEQASKRAANLVKQILTFCRMETIELKPHDFSIVVLDALEIVRASLPTNIEFIEDIHNDLNAVNADETQLKQIILNLCTNASHALEGKNGTIKITLKQLDSKDIDSLEKISRNLNLKHKCVTSFLLRVSDSGHGISLDDQMNMFDPFFTTKETGKGTGLGLSVVHGIVESYNGEIIVESLVGRGTTINIILPALEGVKVGIPAIEKSVGNISSGHILIVEDEPMLADLSYQYLETLGFDVTVTNNGADALELFRQNSEQFSLVFTDHIMPLLSGKDLSTEILAIDPDFPIILATGFGEELSEEELLKMGVCEFLIKPVNLEELIEKINKHISN